MAAGHLPMNASSLLSRADARELGARLKAARTAAAVTQEVAAARIGAARTTIVAIERGDRRLAGEELLSLCDLYGVRVGPILRADAVRVDLEPQFRRAARSDADPAAVEATRLLQESATRYVELERRLGRPLEPDYPPVRRIQRGQVPEQAEDAAAELRARLGLGQSPIPDLLSLIESELRIRLFLLPLPSRISGAYAYHDEIDACILINANHAPARQAWTAAHELGHFMTDRGKAEVLDDEAREDDPAEQFANRFASALLLPAPAVRSRFRELTEAQGRFSPRALVYLALAFHVSVEAAARRLEQLRLLKKGTFEALRAAGLNASTVRGIAAEGGAGTSASAGMQRFLPRYTEVALDAYEQEMISEGELARMLRLGRIETRELLDELDGWIDAVDDMHGLRGSATGQEVRHAGG
jgi:Zn-dependent peptidase ImmA (M78 family)/DNA-binding XRE family transcriptional regulator